MRYGPAKVVANLDREECFMVTDGWMAHAMILQATLPPEYLVQDPLVGSWKSCGVEVIASGTAKQSPAVEQLAILYALGSEFADTIYWKVRWKFTDVGTKLGGLIVHQPCLQDFCFTAMTGRLDFSSLTVADAQRLLYGVRQPLGGAHFRKFKAWLATRGGLDPAVKEVLENSYDYADLARFVQERQRWAAVTTPSLVVAAPSC